MKFRMSIVSLDAIQRLVAQAVASAEDIPAFAGTASVQPAPNGLGTIISRSGLASLGSTGGLTLIKNAAAFTIPSFTTQNSVVRQGRTVHHYAQVQRTTAGDATHECYYPGPATMSGRGCPSGSAANCIPTTGESARRSRNSFVGVKRSISRMHSGRTTHVQTHRRHHQFHGGQALRPGS